MSFEPATNKVKIGSLDEKTLEVYAQYNPKELQIDRTIPWSPHQQANSDGLQLEFTGAQGRELTLELLFDGYETGGTIQAGKTTTTVAKAIEDLHKMASVRKPGSQKDDERRPHHCVVTWGSMLEGDKFQCVITSISTKYQMIDSAGNPLRATCTVKVKEASRVMMAKQSGGGGAQ